MRIKHLKEYGLIVSFDGKYIANIDNGHKYTHLKCGHGYLMVQKRFGNRVRLSFLVHRLVALAFIKNPHNLPEVNHKDGNKLNNHKNNLEWSTRKKNMLHAKQNGLFRDYLRGCKKEVLEMLDEGFFQVEIAGLFGVSQSTISKCKLGRKHEQETRDGISRENNEKVESLDAGGVL